jgi:hypothetical protein
MKLTRKQREALWNLYCRDNSNPTVFPGYRGFRRNVQPYIGGDCVMVHKFNMWFGIESDGYTHT